MPKLYVVYDAEGANDKPIYGVFQYKNLAEAACELLAKKWTDELLAADPEETGLDETDRPWVERQCRAALAIQELDDINKIYE